MEIPQKKEHAEVNLQDLTREVEGNRLKIHDITTLKQLTENKVIERVSGDIIDQISNDESMLIQLGKRTGSYYRDIIFALIQIRLPEEEAERDWKAILSHKYLMSEKLGRNVGIHVATLDYFTNVKRKIIHPKIIDANEYADTASQALTDNLTRAYNRQFFEQELKRLFVLAKTSGRAFSLVMLDLDHFKIYNDLNGHIKGDLALIETVRILHAVCSQLDTVARYGGEEFAMILPDQRLDMGLRTAENIRSAIFDYRYVNEQALPSGRLSASLGVTSFRDDMKAPIEMVEEADVALYRAKNSGRNTIKAFFKEQNF